MLAMPADSMPMTDCHVHVVSDDASRYPMLSPRPYTPEAATAKQLDAMLDRAGLGRVVIVQVSAYGTDNRCLVDAMSAMRHEVRGVIQTTAEVSGAELDAYHARGVRGIRLNLLSFGEDDPRVAKAALAEAAGQAARNGWHVQIFTSAGVAAGIGEAIAECPVTVVLDHFSMLSVKQRGGAEEVAIRGLLADGHVWVKLSGTYRLDSAGDARAGDAVAGLARDLYADNPQQLVWGSDWPHLRQHAAPLQADPPPTPYRDDIDAAELLADCQGWFADDAVARQRILWQNAETLYDF